MLGKKNSSSQGFFVGTLWPVDGALDGPRNGKGKEYILHLINHPKASQVDQSSERLKILPSNISQICLELPTFAPNAFARAMVVFPCLANL